MLSVLPQPAPYDLLHIYYLQGRVNESAMTSPPGFIGNWEEEGESFLFFHQEAETWIARLLAEQDHLELVDQFQMTYEQWQGAEILPYQVGGLQIIPAWYTVIGPSIGQYLRLDPGVVFGTGTHPTSRHCLEALHRVFEDHAISRVLDVGTGTGLLALASAALGARQVVAVDLNHLAVKTARCNVMHNKLDERILVVRGNAKNFMDLSCDLMVSNIHYEVMRQLVETPGFHQPKHFILSGLLRSQAKEIISRLKKRSAHIVDQWEQDTVWFTIYGYTGDIRAQ